jgi:hypothetical protein
MGVVATKYLSNLYSSSIKPAAFFILAYNGDKFGENRRISPEPIAWFLIFLAIICGGFDENPIHLPGISRYVLEFQTCPEIHPQEGLHPTAGFADGSRHATGGMGKAPGGSERKDAQR